MNQIIWSSTSTNNHHLLIMKPILYLSVISMFLTNDPSNKYGGKFRSTASDIVLKNKKTFFAVGLNS